MTSNRTPSSHAPDLSGEAGLLELLALKKPKATLLPATDGRPSVAAAVHCVRCGGEGKLYTSRYGGNDPDVWPVGECPECAGTGYTPEPREGE